jgi:hypothetical protein
MVQERENRWRLSMLRLALLILALALPAQAEDDPAPRPVALIGLPDVLADRLRRAPDDVIADAGAVILGYGEGGAITAAGIATYIAHQEAAERGAVLRRMVEADLNADGTIAADEIAVVVQAAEAGVRGRIMANHMAADADGDGAVVWPEARALADALALAALPMAERERLGAMMALDLDGDGRLALPEVAEAARLMAGT